MKTMNRIIVIAILCSFFTCFCDAQTTQKGQEIKDLQERAWGYMDGSAGDIDFKEALDCCRKLAKMGDKWTTDYIRGIKESKYSTWGECPVFGYLDNGVLENGLVEILHKEADKGDGLAALLLGHHYFSLDDKNNAFVLFKKASEVIGDEDFNNDREPKLLSSIGQYVDKLELSNAMSYCKLEIWDHLGYCYEK